MKEKMTHQLRKCTKCGEYFQQYRGFNESRCESCWEDEPEKKPNEDLLSKFQTGELSL